MDITGNMLTHQSGSRITVVSVRADGGLGLRVKNGTTVNITDLTRAERFELARFILQGEDPNTL